MLNQPLRAIILHWTSPGVQSPWVSRGSLGKLLDGSEAPRGPQETSRRPPWDKVFGKMFCQLCRSLAGDIVSWMSPGDYLGINRRQGIRQIPRPGSPGKVLLVAGAHSCWNVKSEISRNLPCGLLETKPFIYGLWSDCDATAWTAFAFTEEFLVAGPMVPGVWVWFEDPAWHLMLFIYYCGLKLYKGAILDKVKSTWNLYHWIFCLIGTTCS